MFGEGAVVAVGERGDGVAVGIGVGVGLEPHAVAAKRPATSRDTNAAIRLEDDTALPPEVEPVHLHAEGAGLALLVEIGGLEPPTSAMRTQRSPD